MKSDKMKDVYIPGDQLVALAKEIAETAVLEFDGTRIALNILVALKKYQNSAAPQLEGMPSATAINYHTVAYKQQLEVYDRTLEAIVSAAQEVVRNLEPMNVAKGNENMYRIIGKPIYQLTQTIERILEMVCRDANRWNKGTSIDNLVGCRLTTDPHADYAKVERHPSFNYCSLDRYTFGLELAKIEPEPPKPQYDERGRQYKRRYVSPQERAEADDYETE